MEGVNVEGWRVTSIIDAGAQGNDAPITTTSEYWLSPEIGRYVLLKVSDPLRGDSTTRLTNIVLADPDSSLFQIPADYQIVDETGPFYIKYTVPARQGEELDSAPGLLTSASFQIGAQTIAPPPSPPPRAIGQGGRQVTMSYQ